MKRFLEGATDGHDFPHRLHLCGQTAVGRRELFKGEARDLGHHVVNTRLKTRWGGTACDLVAQLVQCVTHGKLGSHLGDRKPGGFGGQSRRTRDTRIHLDNDHASVVRVDGELYIGATGVNSDLAQHSQTGVAQDLVFLVAQRLRRCDGDGVPCVHAHRVEIFDRANDDAVVCLVAHHLHLEFFPSQKRLFNQQLVGRRGFQTALADHLKLFGVIGDAPARASERKAGSNHGRKSDGLLDDPGLLHRMRDA